MQNRKGESPMENTNVLFDRKRLVRLIVPLIVEQVLAVTVGMADMVMVSGAGETAVSGISLVNTICVLLIVIFTSMASGGSVVGAQFLGSGDKKTACHAAEQLVMICGLIALVICGISFFGNRWILRVVFGGRAGYGLCGGILLHYIAFVPIPWHLQCRGSAFPGYGKLKHFNGYFHRDECAEHHRKCWFYFRF